METPYGSWFDLARRAQEMVEDPERYREKARREATAIVESRTQKK